MRVEHKDSQMLVHSEWGHVVKVTCTPQGIIITNQTNAEKGRHHGKKVYHNRHRSEFVFSDNEVKSGSFHRFWREVEDKDNQDTW